MSEPIAFDTRFDAPHGVAVTLSPLLRRVVAPNPGPVTFTGTCSYVVGRGTVAIVDPGPDDPAHVEALLAAVAGESVGHVVVTHTHRDHSPAARAIVAATGARLVGCGPHRPASVLPDGVANPMEASGDRDYRPDLEMREGDAIAGPGWSLVAVETPGHTANHLAFALPEERALLSGDHVMAWATTFVGPPDGAMGPYMASLSKLLAREDDVVYWPGHGGPVTEPRRMVRAILAHRRQREEAILARLRAGDSAIPEIVANVYRGLAPALHGAAALNVLAHLEDLAAREVVRVEGPLSLAARFAMARGVVPGAVPR